MAARRISTSSRPRSSSSSHIPDERAARAGSPARAVVRLLPPRQGRQPAAAPRRTASRRRTRSSRDRVSAEPLASRRPRPRPSSGLRLAVDDQRRQHEVAAAPAVRALQGSPAPHRLRAGEEGTVGALAHHRPGVARRAPQRLGGRGDGLERGRDVGERGRERRRRQCPKTPTERSSCGPRVRGAPGLPTLDVVDSLL
jgi:hypothetical protein